MRGCSFLELTKRNYLQCQWKIRYLCTSTCLELWRAFDLSCCRGHIWKWRQPHTTTPIIMAQPESCLSWCTPGGVWRRLKLQLLVSANQNAVLTHWKSLIAVTAHVLHVTTRTFTGHVSAVSANQSEASSFITAGKLEIIDGFVWNNFDWFKKDGFQ